MNAQQATADFIAKAQTLTTPELFTLGATLRAQNAPEFCISTLIDIIWDRDGEDKAEEFASSLD